MDNIMDFLPIIAIVLMVIFLIGKLKGNGTTTNTTEQSFRTSDEIVMRWKKESLAAKIEVAFSLIFGLGFMLLMLYISFGDDLGLEPLIDFEKLFDFENKNDEEILAFFTNDFIKYIVGFFVVIMTCGLITTVLGTNSFFDLAKWIERNDIDCYRVLKNGNGNKTFNFILGNGFLIKERPAAKNIFYIRIGAMLVIDVLMIMSISKFFKSFMVQTYEAFEVYGMEPGEWAKSVFTSSDALFFYVVLIAAICLNIVVNKILRGKQAELLNSISANNQSNDISA